MKIYPEFEYIHDELYDTKVTDKDLKEVIDGLCASRDMVRKYSQAVHNNEPLALEKAAMFVKLTTERILKNKDMLMMQMEALVLYADLQIDEIEQSRSNA